MIQFCSVGTVLNYYFMNDYHLLIASHRPGLHDRSHRQLKPLVRQLGAPKRLES